MGVCLHDWNFCVVIDIDYLCIFEPLYVVISRQCMKFMHNAKYLFQYCEQLAFTDLESLQYLNVTCQFVI